MDAAEKPSLFYREVLQEIASNFTGFVHGQLFSFLPAFYSVALPVRLALCADTFRPAPHHAGHYMAQSHEAPGRGRFVFVVPPMGHLAVFLLHHLCPFGLQKAEKDVELRASPGPYLCPMDILLKYFSDFTEKQLAQFKALEDLYKDWNSKINVISRKDIESLYEKHILHSLSIAAIFDFPVGTEIVDIGTGGGFPGVPLAIFFPEIKFHLVDSIGKKLKIIEAIKEAIDLPNVTTQHTRAEEIKNRKFDFAVSRAVAPLKELWQWSKPLLKNRTYQLQGESGAMQLRSGLVCLKGGDLAQEISESGLRPKMTEISNLFKEEFFKEKYILYTAPALPK
jgi:16S rRNA (guanine527-N7)-methyltransferase